MAESEVKLTVGEEHVKVDVTKGQNIDMLHRDPERLHDEIKVQRVFVVTH